MGDGLTIGEFSRTPTVDGLYSRSSSVELARGNAGSTCNPVPSATHLFGSWRILGWSACVLFTPRNSFVNLADRDLLSLGKKLTCTRFRVLPSGVPDALRLTLVMAQENEVFS